MDATDAATTEAACDGHSTPADGAECMVCFDDIDVSLYCEYKCCDLDGPWRPSGICTDCIGELIATQYKSYTHKLANPSCAAEQRRLLKDGPPVNVSDRVGLACPVHGDDKAKTTCEVQRMWYGVDRKEHSPKLEGSLEGDARMAFWNEQRAFIIANDKEAGAGEGAAASSAPAATAEGASASTADADVAMTPAAPAAAAPAGAS